MKMIGDRVIGGLKTSTKNDRKKRTTGCLPEKPPVFCVEVTSLDSSVPTFTFRVKSITHDVKVRMQKRYITSFGDMQQGQGDGNMGKSIRRSLITHISISPRIVSGRRNDQIFPLPLSKSA
ncbi:hypothetical protein Tco_0972888 [Tanacetum coccineum]